jgi:two-component system, cell cycle response regulator DivK
MRDSSVQHTILLVRNSEENEGSLLHQLSLRTDLLVLATCSGLDAVQLCATHPEITLAIISSDLQDVNGYEVSRLMRKMRPGLSLMLMLRFVSVETIRLALALNYDRIIQEPIDPDDLNLLLDHHLSEITQDQTLINL